MIMRKDFITAFIDTLNDKELDALKIAMEKKLLSNCNDDNAYWKNYYQQKLVESNILCPPK